MDGHPSISVSFRCFFFFFFFFSSSLLLSPSSLQALEHRPPPLRLDRSLAPPLKRLPGTFAVPFAVPSPLDLEKVLQRFHAKLAVLALKFTFKAPRVEALPALRLPALSLDPIPAPGAQRMVERVIVLGAVRRLRSKQQPHMHLVSSLALSCLSSCAPKCTHILKHIKTPIGKMSVACETGKAVALPRNAPHRLSRCKQSKDRPTDRPTDQSSRL